MPIITAEDVQNYMGKIELDVDEVSFLENVIIPGVQQELETYLNRPVEPVQVRESLTPDACGRIFLTVTPVWQIIGIDYMGQAVVVPTQYSPPVPLPANPLAERQWDKSAPSQTGTPWTTPLSSTINLFTSPMYGYGSDPRTKLYAVVDYVGGWNGYQEKGLKLAMLRVIAREVTYQFDDSLGIRGGTADIATVADGREKGWTEEELYQWNRLRRPVVAT